MGGRSRITSCARNAGSCRNIHAIMGCGAWFNRACEIAAGSHSVLRSTDLIIPASQVRANRLLGDVDLPLRRPRERLRGLRRPAPELVSIRHGCDLRFESREVRRVLLEYDIRGTVRRQVRAQHACVRTPRLDDQLLQSLQAPLQLVRAAARKRVEAQSRDVHDAAPFSVTFLDPNVGHRATSSSLLRPVPRLQVHRNARCRPCSP